MGSGVDEREEILVVVGEVVTNIVSGVIATTMGSGE